MTTYVAVFDDEAEFADGVVVRTDFIAVLPSGTAAPTTGQLWPRGSGCS